MGEFIQENALNELIVAIKGCRFRSNNNSNAEDAHLLQGELPFVSILQVTPEMVKDVYADDASKTADKTDADIEALKRMHAVSSTRHRVENVERILKPGEPWEVDRQPMLSDFTNLRFEPLRREFEVLREVVFDLIQFL
jgi:hypothetical protein